MSGSFVHGRIHIEEYILVGIVGLFVYNLLLRY